MDKNRLLKLASDPPFEEITMAEVMDKTSKAILLQIIKQAAGLYAPDIITWTLTCRTVNQGASYFRFVNKGVVLSAYKVSNARCISRLNLASKIVLIHGILNINPNCERMTFDINCGWDPNPNSVSDPSATRKNIADQSIDRYFDNYHDLKLMGLTYKCLEKESFMQILWQFNGRAEEDVRESMILQISGGDHECHFERTQSNYYPIVGVQSRFVLCGASKDGNGSNDVETICIDNTDVGGEILEANFDRTTWEWKFVLGQDVIMDGERAFSGTAFSLSKSTTITVGGISIRLIPKGNPSRNRRFFRFHK